jgi:uracil-DNA glycosylase family 4
MGASASFDIECRRCPRLAAFLAEVRRKHTDYYCRPVPPFGDGAARLLIVGLAPGKHGANRSGRAFTGDFAGVLLYQTLHGLGIASRPRSTRADDGLRLAGCRITNAVKCLPPENKPTTAEVRTCNRYLAADIERLPRHGVALALGKIAHDAVLRTQGLTLSAYPFAHQAVHRLPRGLRLVDSYHCSRYNTQTGRLTAAMFEAAVAKAWRLALGPAHD